MWGYNYALNGISPDFTSHTGFVNRNSVVNASGFNRLTYYGRTGATLETITEILTPDAGVVFSWDGSKYHYNWSTKALTAGEYRIYANLADGTKRYVDICLTK